MLALFQSSPVPAGRRAPCAQSFRFPLLASLAACVLLAWIPSASAAPDARPLSLAAALSLAEARSYALSAQDHAASAARDLAVEAGRLPDPVLRMSLDNVPIDGPMRFSLSEDFMTMQSVGITQTLTGADKRAARSARFEREADAAYDERVRALTALRQATAWAWFERHFAQDRLGLLQRRADEARLQVEAAEAAYRGTRGAQADVFLA
ncbi:MAG: TolC family protein, partial [Azoarcus sp.]|nr:TolC family protein [Azoarcus sp.]